jgi:hypothetical protein
MHDDELTPEDFVAVAKMAAHERILDRLGDALLQTHDILCLLDEEEMEGVSWIRTDVRFIYRALHQLMKKLGGD